MSGRINFNNSRLPLYDWTYNAISLQDLKAWCETQIENGNEYVSLELEWGYYQDVTRIDLVADTK